MYCLLRSITDCVTFIASIQMIDPSNFNPLPKGMLGCWKADLVS